MVPASSILTFLRFRVVMLVLALSTGTASIPAVVIRESTMAKDSRLLQCLAILELKMLNVFLVNIK